MVRVNTNVAPLGRPGSNPMDLLQTLGQQLGTAQPVNPLQSVQETIGTIPEVVPDPNVERGIPLLTSGAQVENMQDVADYSGSTLLPAAQQEPVIDDTGNIVIDPTTGQPQMRTIGVQDYNDQLAIEKAQVADVATPLQKIIQDPYKSESAVRELLTNQKEASFLSNARQQGRIDEYFEDLDRYVDRVGTPLGNATKSAIDALFTTNTKATVKTPEGQDVPAGIMVMSRMGETDPNMARMLGTMAGVALNQAVTQIGVNKPDKVTGESLESNAPQGTEYVNNMINSVTHFLKNGIRNAQLPVKPADAEFLAKALVQDSIFRGELVSTFDKSGRPVVEASPSLKQQAMALQRVGDAMMGAPSRKASSTTPTPSGTNFSAGRPKLTAKSVNDGSFVTKAADITKNILGSVAYVFRGKDLQRKQRELDMVFAPDQIQNDPETGEFMWSNHPFAKRNGVDADSFRAAKGNVRIPDGFDRTNTTHQKELERIKEEEARKVMSEKKMQIEFTMQSLRDKTGLRYGEFMHSLSNQRFFISSYDLDYMGSKNVIRDVMGMAYQDPVRVDYLFDPQPMEILKRKATWVFQGTGEEIHKNLTEKLNPSELGALGTMHNAVMYYYTALSDSVPNVTKMPVADAIQLYTPAIGEKLAGLGMSYNQFLEGKPDVDSEMMSLWVAAEKGEGLGTMNLWDDFFKAKSTYDNPATKRNSIPATHHVFDDGNQNGIFLQSLFFGMENRSDQNNAVVRLGVANPNLNDMRVYGMETLVHTLDNLLVDNEDQRQAWRAFWAEAISVKGKDEVAKDYFKKPLMQNAYGKDASMFSDLMYGLLEVDGLYSELLNKHLLDTGAFKDIDEAAKVLSQSVELSLRQLIDSKSTNMMKSIGRAFAILNTPMTLPGITGDTYVISPVGIAPLNKKVGDKNYVAQNLPNGQSIFLKKPSYVSDTITDPETGQSVELPSFGMQLQPAATKGTQLFLNRKTMQYDEFHNPMGMSLARQAAVLTIQSLDGDLVKWATIEANKGLKVPRPVTWVHDSIISTPGQSLVYTNMYNNVAIRNAIPEIKKLGKKIDASLKQAKKDAVERVLQRGEPVGIGSEGEFPAMGALFDQYAMQIDENDPTYKNIFIERAQARANQGKAKRQAPRDINSRFQQYVKGTDEKSPEAQWENWKQGVRKILDEAESLGWVDPKVLPPNGPGRYLAIDHKNFPKMLDLSFQLLKLEGPSSRYANWIGNFENRVSNAEQVLMAAARNGGIRQMSSSGGKKGKPIVGEPNTTTVPAKVAKPADSELLVPEKVVPPKPALDLDPFGVDSIWNEKPPF
jgi:hypothetical protein